MLKLDCQGGEGVRKVHVQTLLTNHPYTALKREHLYKTLVLKYFPSSYALDVYPNK